MTRRVLPVSLSVLLLCVGTSAWPAASDDYRAGILAFNEGRYSAAEDSFMRVYDAGSRDPTLFYNLGSAQFKLGEYAAAYQSFDHIAADPKWGALAQYNLGLIEERRDNLDQAQRHYQAAYDAAQSDKIPQIAALKLSAPVRTASVDAKWFGIVSSPADTTTTSCC